MGSIFDILGPITVGPSSSHTAGAIRIGLVCRRLLREDVKEAEIKFYGSFAETYKGHGTDKALIGGLLGLPMASEDVKESFAIAEKKGLKFSISTAQDPRYHPNTVAISAKGERNEITIRASSVGGGSIKLNDMNGYGMDISCDMDTLVIRNRDNPGALAAITKTMSDKGYNIGTLRLSRSNKGGDAVTIVEMDERPENKLIEALKELPLVIDVVLIPKL